MDRLCTERHPGVWHNGGSPRHLDASHDFFILYFLRMSSAREGGGGGAARLLNTDHHLRFVTVCGLCVVFIPTIAYLHCQNKPSLREETQYYNDISTCTEEVQNMYRTCTIYLEYL